MPHRPAVGSVMAKTTAASATGASVMWTFSPCSTHEPPWRVAVVCIE